MPTPDLWLTNYQVAVPSGVAADPNRIHARSDDFHRTVMSLFGQSMTRHGRAEWNVLWRLEQAPDERWRILIQSTAPPTAEAASLPHISVKPVHGLFARLTAGTAVQYTIQASAVQRFNSTQADGTKFRKNIALTPAQAHKHWGQRAARVGLALTPDTLTQHRLQPHPFKQPISIPSRFLSDVFSGHATITDTAALTTAIRRGIGQGKPYGRGMLTVVPASA